MNPEDRARFRAALEEAASDPQGRQGLTMEAGCIGDSAWRSMKIFEDGVAVWGGEQQFELSDSEITGLLQQLLDADFASLPDRFGGSKDPDRMQATSARSVVCSLIVAVAGAEKEVLQINRGEQSESFARLVNGLLDSCEEKGASGVGVSSLEEGLEKVASGELEPVTFELHFQRLAEGAAPGAVGTEFILAVEGPIATTRLRDPVEGYSEPSRIEMTAAEISELAWRLSEGTPSRLPGNLWAPSYTDLALRVLNQRLSLVARPYRGVDRETHGELQRDFDSLVELLESLHERVLEEGKPTSTDL